MFPLAQGLVARGHEVVWNTSALHRERIEAIGARLVPFEHARDYLKKDFDPQEFAPGKKLSGLASLNLAIKHAFIGGMWFHEKTDLPLAVLNGLPMALNNRDTAPSGACDAGYGCEWHA